MSKQKKLFGGDDEPEARKNIPLEEAKKFADKVLMDMAFNVSFETVSLVGSVRRKRETVNDVDFVVIASDKEWLQLRNFFVGELKARKVCAGDKILRYILDGIQTDFYRATEDTYGIYKLIRTGSAEHNIYLAKLAIKKGMRLLYSQGLIKNGKVVAGASETNVFDRLGLPFIEPKFREIVDGKPMWELK